MKKFIITGIAILLLAIIGVGLYYMLNKKANNPINLNENQTIDSTIQEEENSKDKDENTISSGRKILVVYYSAQSHTESVAKKIASNLNADIFEIEPVNVYTSDDLNWTNSGSRVSREHDNESLRNIELKNTKVDNWDSYDTVLIGYPIWWGVAAWPVITFVKANNFNGKTIIPFCTSASSSIGNSGKLLENEAGSGNWLSGQRFSSNPSDKEIQSFTNSID